MIIDTLKAENIKALKNRDSDARSILSVAISKIQLDAIEIKAKGKVATDEDAVRIIVKMLKELDDEKDGFVKVHNLARVEGINHQIEILSAFLPKMLSEEEIREEIAKLDDKSIPSIMKHFKANFAGKVDMGLVNKIARNL